MNRFVQAALKDSNRKTTENLQSAFRSTGVSAVLDFFSMAGALRSRSPEEIGQKMARAFEENPLLALRLLFYLGDIRGGLGERRSFQIGLRWLALRHPAWAEANLENVPHYNRWDSLFVLKDTPCEAAMLKLLRGRLDADLAAAREGSSGLSLLAKWLPSVNASSPGTLTLARWFAGALGYREREYRRTLSGLRGALQVVERRMSGGDWQGIPYSQVPSLAMTRYRRAFARRDGKRFSAFLEDVARGRSSIRAETLFPYNIVEGVLVAGGEDPVLEAQWRALPDYLEGEPHNILVMADVSGSMAGRPMATAVGLALLFAGRNRGPYRNLFLTFSENPRFEKVTGNTLREQVLNLSRSDWGTNTDLAAAFRKILRLAQDNGVPAEEMPKALLVISDMEIDDAAGEQGMPGDFVPMMEEEFARAGYPLPALIFWNVDSRQDTLLTEGSRRGIQLVSGQSPSVFRAVLRLITRTPYEAMLVYLQSGRYDRVAAPEGAKRRPPRPGPAGADPGPHCLETGRLLLRPLAMDDLEAVHAWAQNPEVIRFMSWGPNSLEETRAFLAGTVPGEDFAVTLKGEGRVIGSCGIYPGDAGDSAELGFILKGDFRGQGYGTELCGELIRHGFEALGLRRIFAPCAADNRASRRTMERNGMRLEALRPKAFRDRTDEACYAILASEYFGLELPDPAPSPATPSSENIPREDPHAF